MEKKKTHSEVFMFEKDLPWEPAGENVTRQVLGYDGQVTMVKVKFEKGSVGTPHALPHSGNLCGERKVRVHRGWKD